MSEEASTTNPSSEKGPGGLTGKYYCSIRLFDYKRPKPFDTATENVKKTINLPLPIQLMDLTASSFSGQDMGLVGDILDNQGFGNIAAGGAFRLLSNSAEVTSNMVSRFIPSSISQKLSNIFGAINDVSKGAGFDIRNISTAIEQTVGAVANPNPTIKFNGPILRDMTFTWYLNPKNEAESKTIESIIRHLKSAALPSRALTGSVGILNYPKLVQVNFYPWDESSINKNKWGWSDKSIIRMKRCFMTNVSVNYNPVNYPAFFHDNSPVVIELSIGLKEIEYFFSGEWNEGGVQFDDGTSSTISGLIERGAAAGESIINSAKSITNDDTRNAQQ